MKKFLLFILCIFLIGGCSKKGKSNAIKEFESKVNKSNSYHLVGTMSLLNDEEVFEYDIDVSYLKDNNYKVDMINKANDHKQIILKNNEGLYVITPSLNKSFKFESNWPDNSSQSYLLSSLLKDIKNDTNASVKEEDDKYIITSSVSYPNNKELKYQKIYLDKDYNLKMVEVLSENDMVKIKTEFNEVNLKAGIKDDIFDLKKYVTENDCEDDECKSEKTMSKIENAIYPLYMPSNTYLSGSEVINNDTNSRIILTFSGDKNFVIVEEGSVASLNHEVIPVYGEPVMINNTIGAISQSSMYWTSNDIDYYLASDDLTSDEMVYVASSLTNARATIYEK